MSERDRRAAHPALVTRQTVQSSMLQLPGCATAQTNDTQNPDRPSVSDRPALWDSLTAAELRVVGLVAEGFTNGHIARRLHLSRYTVETHLKHVFIKLKVSSRAALAAEAARREVKGTRNT